MARKWERFSFYFTFWTTSKWLVGVWARSPGIFTSIYTDILGVSQTHQGWTVWMYDVLLFFLILRDTLPPTREVENDYFGDQQLIFQGSVFHFHDAEEYLWLHFFTFYSYRLWPKPMNLPIPPPDFLSLFRDNQARLLIILMKLYQYIFSNDIK